jgi:hypothetical protein
MEKNKKFVIGLIEVADLNNKNYMELYAYVSCLIQHIEDRAYGTPEDLAFFCNLIELANNFYNSYNKYPDWNEILNLLQKYIEVNNAKIGIE